MRRILVSFALALGIAAIGAGTASAACVKPYCAAPIATTGAATAITQTSATLNGAISANGSGPTAYQFQILTAPDTFSTVAAGGGPDGYGSTSVSANVTGLEPGTTYSYRIIVGNDGGLRLGQILSFTTAAVPPPPPPDSGGGATPGGTTPGGSGEPSSNPAVDPDDVSIQVNPRSKEERPYRYRVSGRVVTGDRDRCRGGEVSIRVATGGEEVTRTTASLRADCSYALRVTVPADDLKDSGKLNIRSVFTGTDTLNAMSSSTVKVTYG